jgi:cytolysin (calcineurin-like family phosphatase)
LKLDNGPTKEINVKTLAARTLILVSLFAAQSAAAQDNSSLDVTFFVTSDTHVCSSSEGVSPDVAKQHVLAMNTATSDKPEGQQKWPVGVPSAGKRIQEPKGVVLAGDLASDRVYDLDTPWGNCWGLVQELYSGWKDYQKEWSLRFLAYPGFGNHDWADHECKAEKSDCGNYTFKANASNRVMANFVAKVVEGRTSSLHWMKTGHLWDTASSPPLYSWNWGRLHLVNLNTWAGEPFRWVQGIGTNPGGYKSNEGWEWLKADLKAHADKYGAKAPIIIFQHYGYDGAGTSAAPRGYGKVWWSQGDRDAFEDIIAPYNVIALFTGHSHEANWRWFGSFKSVLNVSAGNGFASGGFWAVHVTDSLLEAAYLTKDVHSPDSGKTFTHPELTVSERIETRR